MKPRSLLAILATVLLVSSNSSAYELTSLGLDGGWKDQPVQFVLDQDEFTTDNGLTVNDVEDALLNAFGTWASADTQDKLEFLQLSDGGGNYDVFDGSGGSLDQTADWTYANITIGGWLDKSYFDSLATNGGDSILAVSVTAKLRGGARKPSWTSDIYFNDGFTWSTNHNGDFDIETVALHELGHSIGFDHESTAPSVMAPYYGGVNTTLTEDDLAGLAALYGGGGGGKKGGGGGGKGGPKRIVEIDTDVFITGVTLVDGFTIDFSTAQQVPEPSSSTLLIVGLAFCALRGRRRS
ncbi:MAG: matrixin family metalloprotease [Planctomycetales bacterium]|nr:matrixin family metalloprotease [Planctomycetales bacterium]